MHYFFSCTGDKWFDELIDREVGYGWFVDRELSVVLVTHGNADGHLPCVERHDQWALLALADKVVCCYPAAVQRRYPSLNVVGDWDEPSKVVSTEREAMQDYLVEVLSNTEHEKYYGDAAGPQQAV